jgi:hypothetical protein
MMDQLFEFNLRKIVRHIVNSLIFLFVVTPMSVFAQNNTALNSDFLKQQPYKKGKQAVDLSNIKNHEDMLIVKESINDVMRAITLLAYTEKNIPALKEITTSEGFERLEFPPVQNKSNRFISNKINNWKIINPSTLSFDVEFRDLLKEKPAYHSSFVFVKTEHGWKFDRHP